MTIQRFTLSARLSLLLLAALACVVIPLLFVAYSYVGGESRRADRKNFLSILEVVEENIHTQFLHLNETKVKGIVRAKEKLRRAARLLARLGDQPGELTDAALSRFLAQARQNCLREHLAEGIWLDTFTLQALLQAPQTALRINADMKDFKGSALSSIIASLPQAGVYGFYRLPGYGPMLLYFLPSADTVVLSAMSVQHLENETEAASKELVRALAERFATFALHKNGFIALLDAKGAYLAGQGIIGEPELAQLRPLLKKTGDLRRETVLPLRRSDGTEAKYYAAASFSYPFNWFTIIAAPLTEIDASSQVLLQRLIALSMVIGLAALGCSLFLLRRVVRPLSLLCRKSQELPALDFARPESWAFMACDLPLNRRDEVGDLARAFVSMGEQLRENVNARMEAAALRERMLGELGAALAIQRGILPPPDLSPNLFGLSSSAMLEPAGEIGGDLYYFFTLPDGRYAFVIGDVSGKGVPAALFMAITVTLAKYALTSESSPGAALERINAMLEAHNPQSMFVTLFMALYDSASGRVAYANAGHNPPLVTQGGAVKPLEGLSGPMLGVVPGATYQSFLYTMDEGELCLLYTDGVTEAVNEAGELYGEQRLEYYMRENSMAHPRELLTGIFADVARFRGQADPFDDITMLAFARR